MEKNTFASWLEQSKFAMCFIMIILMTPYDITNVRDVSTIFWPTSGFGWVEFNLLGTNSLHIFTGEAKIIVIFQLLRSTWPISNPVSNFVYYHNKNGCLTWVFVWWSVNLLPW